MNIWTRIMIAVMCICCKRLGWQIAVGRDEDHFDLVTDIIVGPPGEVDRICAMIDREKR